MHCLFSRSLMLGSALLTLLLLSDSSSLIQARVTDNNNNKIVDIPTVNHRPHSPYSTDSPDSPSTGLYQDSFTKRSLYPRIHDDSILAEEAAAKAAFIQQQRQRQRQQHNDFEQEQEQQQQQQQRHHVLDSALGLDFWGDDEERTLIEPRFPSIDLFEEEDEVFELGDDGILRKVDSDSNSRHHNYLFDPEEEDDGEEDDDDEDEENRYDQIWMVDEWEEELERDIDVLMDWAEEDGILNSRLQAMQIEKEEAEKQRKLLAAKVLGSHGLHGQDSIRNALMDEDEASPFRRVISESWLF